jgi:hypothetical protein
VSDAAAVATVVDEAARALGGVDLVVHAAGVYTGALAIQSRAADAPIGCFVRPGDVPAPIAAGIGPDVQLEIMTGGRLLEELTTLGLQPADIRP